MLAGRPLGSQLCPPSAPPAQLPLQPEPRRPLRAPPTPRAAPPSQAPSRLILAADYLLSSATNVAVAAALYCLAAGQASALPAAGKAAAAVLAWAVAAQWLRGRPTAGVLFGEQAFSCSARAAAPGSDEPVPALPPGAAPSIVSPA